MHCMSTPSYSYHFLGESGSQSTFWYLANIQTININRKYVIWFMALKVLHHDVLVPILWGISDSHCNGAKPMCFMNKKQKSGKEEEIWGPTLSFKDMPPSDLKTFQNSTTF